MTDSSASSYLQQVNPQTQQDTHEIDMDLPNLSISVAQQQIASLNSSHKIVAGGYATFSSEDIAVTYEKKSLPQIAGKPY